jgi:hypothetical protein
LTILSPSSHIQPGSRTARMRSDGVRERSPCACSSSTTSSSQETIPWPNSQSRRGSRKVQSQGWLLSLMSSTACHRWVGPSKVH